MITAAILNAFFGILAALFAPLPIVTELPFGIDVLISTGMGYVSYIMVVFPPLQIIYNGFLWVLTWKGVLLFLRFFKVTI